MTPGSIGLSDARLAGQRLPMGWADGLGSMGALWCPPESVRAGFVLGSYLRPRLRGLARRCSSAVQDLIQPLSLYGPGGLVPRLRCRDLANLLPAELLSGTYSCGAN